MDQYGISKLDLKRRNRMQILKLLQQQGPTSRIDLSASLDLTRAAVTIITNEMIEQGVLYEKGEISLVGKKASRGRKKVLIDINTNFKFAFGIAADRKKIYIGLSNISGDTLEKRVYELRANDTKESILQQIFANMQEMAANNCLENSQILGAGVCLSERALRFLELRTENGIVDYSPLEQLFAKEFAFPVVFDSLVNGLAMAEIDFFEGYVSGDNSVLVRFSDHIDAALMVGNEIYRGTHNRAMELAHLTVDPDGKTCYCGKKGCLISEFSDDSIYVDIVNAFSAEATPLLYERMNGNPNLLRVAEVSEYLLLEDEGITALFDKRLKGFCVFLNNLIAIIDPQRVILFGHQFENERYMARLKEYIKNALGVDIANIIAVGSLCWENIYLSGCALAIRRFFIDKGGFDQDSNN